jgi:seryl-tRNA synthetase
MATKPVKKPKNELSALQARYNELSKNLPDKIARGGDPAKLAAEIHALKQRIEALIMKDLIGAK